MELTSLTIKSKPNKAVPEWHLIDASSMTLGRLSTKAAQLLLGKHRLDFARHLVAPVFVIIVNTDRVTLTGLKENQKLYQHFTGYPGGLKSLSVQEQRHRDSRQIVGAAVFGMLPKNSLRDKRMNHLKLYTGADHPHQAQL